MKIIISKLLSRYLNLTHAYTTREKKLSIYGGNLAYHVNDTKENVDTNHKKLSDLLKYPLHNLVYMNQVHKDKVIKVTKDLKNTPSCDALMTDEKNIPLMVMVADCIPILLYDPVKEAIAVVHAGRAGIFNKILPKTIKQMQNEYGCKSEDLIVSLGASIHQCCYEVGDEIKKEAEELGVEYAIKEEKGHLYLDLISIAKKQLEKLNIPKENIEISQLCTSCNTDLFFSYRAEKKCGRFAGVLMLK